MINVSKHGQRAPGTMAYALGLSVLLGGCNAFDSRDEDRQLEADGVPLAEGSAIQLQESALTTVGALAADAKVRSGSYANTNYGTSSTLQVDGEDAGTQYETYLRFSVGNVGTITSAKLRLYVVNPSPGPHTVKLVSSNSWSETGITWNNKPATGITVATIGQAATNTWLEVDISSVVAPNTTVSLAILPGNNDGLDVSSRNSSTNKPQIVIETDTTGGPGNTITTDANLKIAFVGDTADGSNWGNVLTLAKNEGAAAIVVAGDMTYDSDPTGWWSKTESVVGTSFPVFLARGNHDDDSWDGFLPKAANHLGGAARTTGSHNAATKTIFRGLNLVAIKKGDSGAEINSLFGNDAHIWKVCAWHQNQAKMQVGGKGDEMGWDVYETCRQNGAIIMTGHEHTYHRTKTMTNITNQTIDPSCSSGGSVCVGRGRTFVSVTGTGGTGLRGQVRCTPTESSPPYASLNTSDSSCPIWASIYTTNQGAQYGTQFIVFNVDGNPKKARSYFKNISGQIIDDFTIFAD